jgi:methylated-DNA-[protein]-cysteine S-methyltransferase
MSARRQPTLSGQLVITSTDTPWGPARIAVGQRGVAALSLLTPLDAFGAGLERRGFGPVIPLERSGDLPSVSLAREVAERVSDYLAGAEVPLGDLPVDLADRSDWDRLVLEAVRSIPRGETVGYGGVARRIGRTGAARAVGGAVGRNPVGLLIPCHRVIAGDGSLGGYGVAAWGGREAALDLKRRLLALEGIRIA